MYKMLYSIKIIALCILYMAATGFSHAEIAIDKIINVGVLAIRGPEVAMARWLATAEYLNQAVPEYHFVIKPLSLAQTAGAVQNKEIDFILTNTGNYVELEYRYGISRLATLKTFKGNNSYTLFGAVIFTTRKHTDINTLADLKDKRFVAVSRDAFGGFQMAWRELKKNHIDPFSDLKQLQFAGLPHDNIVYSVLAGKADAGTVRGDVIERMIKENKINMNDIKIINQYHINNYPFLLSTQLYPEWPFAKLKHVDDRLSQRVAIALFTLEPDSKAAKISDSAGWTIPLDYNTVHDLFRELKAGPYQYTTTPSLTQILLKYWHLIAMSAFVIIALASATLCVTNNNRRLRLSQQTLREEVDQRKRIQTQLAEHRDSLEEKIQERTNTLARVNEKLQVDIASRKKVETALRNSEKTLKNLHRVFSTSEASFEIKVREILKISCKYLNLQTGIFSCFEDGSHNIKHYYGNLLSKPKHLSEKIAQKHYIKLWQNDLVPKTTTSNVAENIFTGTLKTKYDWQTYLVVPIIIFGQLAGCLEFADPDRKEDIFTAVEIDIIRLIAQWIASEAERQKTQQQAQSHQAELSHVTRLNTMGEMASSLAHELNQPLTAIVNYTRGCIHRLMRRPTEYDNLITALQSVSHEAERAAEVIQRLWNLVKKGPPKIERTNINHTINTIIKFTSPEFRKHHINIHTQLDPRIPPILVDKIQIEQVLINLFINAIEAMRDIPLQYRSLNITSTHAEKYIRICVKDQGPGLAENIKNNIFQPFSTTKEHGMGMGLSISRSIIEKHRGKLYHQETVNVQGATFCFNLPHCEAES